MPRAWNQIQNPEIGAQLAKVLGLRQLTAMPTVAETLQPVIIVGDTTGTPPEPVIGFGVGELLDPASLDYIFALRNPPGSGVEAHLDTLKVTGLATEHRVQLWYTRCTSGAAYDNIPIGNGVGQRKRILPLPSYGHIKRITENPAIEFWFTWLDAPVIPFEKQVGEIFCNQRETVQSHLALEHRAPNIIIDPGHALLLINSSPLSASDGIYVQASWHETQLQR